MSRIKIKLPSTFPFSTEITVRISDINYGGHLGNDTVLSLMHEARARLLEEHGFTELNINGLGLIMVDAAVVYKSESFHGDSLIIEICLDNFTKYGCDFIYKITKKQTGREVARAKTGMVFFDYQKRKLVEAPETFKATFAATS
jgi:acyl-CoA thioesterase FadM